MNIELRNRTWAALLLPLAWGLAVACGASEEHLDESVGDPVVLEGPWPAEVIGDFEVAEISDAGGEDYMAFGWITTDEGIVLSMAYGKVLKQGNAEGGGKIHAQVMPSPDSPDSYEIVRVKRVE